VIGADPDAQLEIEQGVVVGDQVGYKDVIPSLHFYRPEAGGFIVVKAKPDTLYVIGSVKLTANGSMFGAYYRSCGHGLAFQTQRGKVLYITSVQYVLGAAPVGRGVAPMAPSYSEDLGAARAFLQAHYPSLADKVEQGESRTVDVRIHVRCR
jgi:hypothetical protein